MGTLREGAAGLALIGFNASLLSMAMIRILGLDGLLAVGGVALGVLGGALLAVAEWEIVRALLCRRRNRRS